MIKDYQSSVCRDLDQGTEEKIDLPKSNVLQFFLEDGSKISMRPSGTEPKIKFYFGVKGELTKGSDFEKVKDELNGRIGGIVSDLDL